MFKVIAKRLYKKLLARLSSDLKSILSTDSDLHNRVFSYYRNRWNAIDDIADYLVGAEIDGDYGEFGVYRGTTFSYAYKVLSPIFSKMRFIAFDSFAGLPVPKGLDNQDGFTSSFFEGQFVCSEEEFIEIMKANNVDLSRVITVKGFFNETLNSSLAKRNNISQFALVWIDCDLYESTVPVLDFITDKIVTGTVIVFDDWHCFRNLPNYGEQKACREWLDNNTGIVLHKLLSIGFHGEAFKVELK